LPPPALSARLGLARVVAGRESPRREDEPTPTAPAVRATTPAAGAITPPAPARTLEASPAFFAVYDEYFPYVWRNLRRLGVAADAASDVAQDVFLVVHRRLAAFEGRSELRTWLYAIVLRVVRDHRRHLRRKRLPEVGAEPLDAAADPSRSPYDDAERAEEVARLYALLDELDEELRDVFVLAELEELPVPAIAQIAGVNVNTVYGRLRRARLSFQAAVARRRAQDARRPG
jgi:RNA polymerase sigma-70 factor (ECF subfamily)